MRQLHEQNTALHAQVKELTAAAAVTAGATSSEEAFKVGMFMLPVIYHSHTHSHAHM